MECHHHHSGNRTPVFHLPLRLVSRCFLAAPWSSTAWGTAWSVAEQPDLLLNATEPVCLVLFMTDKINLCYIPNPIKITEYRVPFIIAIPHLAHFWLKILGSRPLNKPNPGSLKTCWRPSLESRFGKHTLAKNGSVFLINTSFIYFLLTSFFVPCCKLERVFPARIYGPSARCVRQKPERKNEIP